HSLRTRDRRAQPAQDAGAVARIDVPAQPDGVLLVRGFVSVRDGAPGEGGELHGDLDGAAGPQPVDVLASAFRRRDVGGAAVTLEDLSLLEMDVDGMIPAAAAVAEAPDLAGAHARRGGDPAEVGVEHHTAVGLDAPRAVERRVGIEGGVLP